MRLVFVGASGHGKVCAEIAELCGYKEILFLDDNRDLKECAGYPVVGIISDYEQFIDSTTCFFVSIGDGKTREYIQEKINMSHGTLTTLIHPTAIVSKHTIIGNGTVIMAGTVINSSVVIEHGCIVNTSSSIDHDCEVRAYSHIAVGAHLCGSVNIGENCWIGAGAIINNNLSICDDCMVGAGAVVIEDIEKVGTYIGVPARKKD